MGTHAGLSWSAGRLRRRVLAAAVTVLLLPAACGDDSGGTASGGGGGDSETTTDLLGPADPASGDPVRIGLVSDGQTQAFDATGEIDAAQATVDYWNAHQGGIGGRPIELVVCETGADPAGGTDCGNQMIEQDVAAVVVGQSTVPDAIWEPLHQEAVPTMFFQTNGESILTDPTSSFVLSNPLTTAFGLPISVAEDEGVDKVAFVVLDVPVAVSLFESLAPDIMDNADLDYEIVKIPPGSADVTSQMSDLVENGAGVVQIVGYDAFCIAAVQGLRAGEYTGKFTAVSQCVTDATRDALTPEELERMYVTSGVALGATDDPSYQRYEAVMDAFGDEIDVNDNVPMVGYTVTAALASSLDGITGEVTPSSIADAIKAMPLQELPGGGGITFRCGGSVMATNPAVCSNEWLRSALDADGQPVGYQAVDSTSILEGL
jgi:branched-chain amino acid transport system substrate-binding protein